MSDKLSVAGDWKLFNKYIFSEDLVRALDYLPENWALTPLLGKKPYRKNWQYEPALERNAIAELLNKGEQRVSKKGNRYKAYISGYGLRTGKYSGGLLAIDIDGAAAIPVLESLGELPKTVAWSSGKPGRAQLLFQIPEKIQGDLDKFTRGIVKTNVSGEQLEFRYNECQSVLPPSYHPNTGNYFWLDNPHDTPVAIAPDWLCEFVLKLADKENLEREEKERLRTERLTQLAEKRRLRALNQLTGEITLEEVLEASIARLGSDGYKWSGHNFVQRGKTLQGNCPNHVSASGRSFHVETDTNLWYCHGCKTGGHLVQYHAFWKTGDRAAASKDGKLFVEIVKEIASDANVEFPEFKPQDFPHPEAYKEYIEWELEQERIDKAIEWNEYLEELRLAHLSRAGDFQKAIAFTKPKVIYYPRNPLPTPYNLTTEEVKNLKIIFAPGFRNQGLEELIRLGWDKILDTSGCGSGKSHSMGIMENPEGKIFLATREHRNPTVETIERNYRDLSTRHNGLVKERNRKTPLGEPFLRNAKPGEKPDVASLCKNASLFHDISAKGYDLQPVEGQTTNPICAKCSYFQQKITTDEGVVLPKCAAKIGDGYGFMYARKTGLLADKIRLAMDSAPHPEQHDYSRDYLFIDEAETSLKGTRNYQARLKDIDRSLIKLSQIGYDDIFQTVRELIDRLYPYLEGTKKTPYWGLDHEDILKLYDDIPEDFDRIIKAAYHIQPDFTKLIVEPDRIDFNGFAKKDRRGKSQAYSANWEFIKEADRQTAENIKNLEVNWLVYFLLIISGQIQGSIRVNNHKLILDIRDFSHAQKVLAAKFTYIADATFDREQLGKVLNIEESNILHIEQERHSLKNLTIYNINTPKLRTNKPGENGLRNFNLVLESIKKQHNLPADFKYVIGHKSYGLDFYWFRDTRGTNQFSGQPILIVAAEPRINLGEAKAQYLALYGTLVGFKKYYRSLIEKEIWQFLGRQRVHLYPGQEFVIFWVGTNIDLNFIKTESDATVIDVDACEYDVEASTSFGKTLRHRTVKIVEAIIKSGQKVTQKAVAETMNLTQGRVSQFCNQHKKTWLKLKKILADLINDPNRQINIFDDARIKRFIDAEPLSVVQESFEVIKDLGWEGFQEYLRSFSLHIQIEIWSLLSCLFLSEKEKDFILAKKGDYES